MRIVCSCMLRGFLENKGNDYISETLRSKGLNLGTGIRIMSKRVELSVTTLLRTALPHNHRKFFY